MRGERKAIGTSNIYRKPATPGTQELSSAGADYARSQREPDWV